MAFLEGMLISYRGERPGIVRLTGNLIAFWVYM